VERHRIGPLAWTFPAAIVMGMATVCLWLVYAAVTRSAVPACELLPRTAWAFASAAGGALFLLPWTYIDRPFLRIGAGLLLGGGAAAAAFFATAALFPRFC
jgi:hypothetical protein